ncbi:MAG: bifunctional metallophosphatase/5'-nucleotidase [Erysipelotrichaceae bacterium]|nr:bifunctional metallophosphatase/5'-nucleotidase [Erysipelotrichaceae bacterium]
MAIKKLTLLHSNDLHGDFLPHHIDGKEIGGISRLSGYIHKVRKEEENVLYVIAGDMFRGSIIDEEYRGLSTIEMVNLLEPDVATIGNHEVDYGVAHLLFLEKCARFPIINANLYITLNSARLFQPHLTLESGGMRILFIGILTEEVIASTRSEKVIGSFIDVEEAAREIGIICDNYRTTETDMVVLLTHIGIEEDRKLAALLDPDWGVDFIIGAHTHTFMSRPEVINGIPIVQAGTGTSLLGRFDIEYDSDLHQITDYRWSTPAINEDTAPRDEVTETMLERFRSETDAKYKRIVTRLARKLTHPQRNQETELGNLYADLLQDESSFEIMLMGSGSIRKEELGPIVEYQDMVENTPYDDNLWMLKVSGKQFRQMVSYLMRDEAWSGHTEFYQFSRGVRIVWKKSTHELLELSLNGEEITEERMLLIALQNYHFVNFTEFFGVPFEEVAANMKPRVVATSINNIIEEYLSVHHGLDARVEGRITILD